MTKVMCKINNDDTKMDGSIFFDCMNHAGNREVCIMCSTLCNVLQAACERAKVGDIMESEAHMQISVDKIADGALLEVFASVMEVFKGVAEQFPDMCKVY